MSCAQRHAPQVGRVLYIQSFTFSNLSSHPSHTVQSGNSKLSTRSLKFLYSASFQISYNERSFTFPNEWRYTFLFSSKRYVYELCKSCIHGEISPSLRTKQTPSPMNGQRLSSRSCPLPSLFIFPTG